MLNFSELGGNGRRLEQLVRELLLLLDMHPQWSGQGPDAGRDLVFDERGDERLGAKPRRWLVSCKDYSTSGRAVGIEDVNGLIEAVRQHGSQAFLLACSTHPSAAVTERLRAIEDREGIACHIWDGVTLERLLNQPRTWALAQQFMPVSAAAQDWRLFGTEYPNSWVAVHRGQYFHLSSRTAGGMNYDLVSLSARFDELQAIAADWEAELRVRGIWHNDTHGAGYLWYVDCMWNRQRGAAPDGAVVEAALRSGAVREDGQFHDFEVVVRLIDWGRDHFDMDHYEYYSRVRH